MLDFKFFFRRFSVRCSEVMGASEAFVLAVLVIAIWAITGPHFNYSDTWQLVINTTSSVLTLLIAFLIQNTQNRDAKALQLKMDELISVTGARTCFIGLEECSDEEIEQIAASFNKLHKKGELPDSVRQYLAPIN